ncbi:TPA: glycosyltransferase family 32 protein [Streptococcus pneumoniae]
MIPKKIHYIWFGGSEKPDVVLKCINSWKKYMPDYEIVEWNEDNFDLSDSQFAKSAYESRKWAFASDYARFKILSKYGGIYFDTDVELLKTIPDDILAHSSFTGFEYIGEVNPGLVYACMPDDKIAKYMVQYYEQASFDINHLVTVNTIITDYLLKNNFQKNNQFQIIDGLAIYPDDCFCGYDQEVKEVRLTERTISIHHYSATWKTRTLKRKVQMIVKTIIGAENYRKLLYCKRKITNAVSK